MTDTSTFIRLHAARLNEQARLEARLTEINAVLGQDVSVPAASPAAAPATTAAPKKKRKMSAAGKANIIAAIKARWAKVNAAKK